MVPMRDVRSLATDVYLPVETASSPAERLPAILIRTPYDRQRAATLGPFLVSHDYALVIRTRAAVQIGGHLAHAHRRRAQMASDAAAWIARQPWSNVTSDDGTSYTGGTQHALAMAGSPHLKTVIPVDAVSNPGIMELRNAGAFELRFWNWVHSFGCVTEGNRRLRDSKTREALQEFSKNRRLYLRNLPLRRGTTPLKLIRSARSGWWRRCDMAQTTASGPRTTSSITATSTKTSPCTWSRLVGRFLGREHHGELSGA